jgi:copper chaperone
MPSKTVRIPDISCGHCVATIEREVGELPGVDSVQADEKTKDVTISWDDGATSWQAIEDLLREIEFPPHAG